MLSDGGGNLAHTVNPNIVAGLQDAKARGLRIHGMVGRDGGYTWSVGDAVVTTPAVAEVRVTPHTEAF